MFEDLAAGRAGRREDDGEDGVEDGQGAHQAPRRFMGQA
jgi:hypothetical protein